MAIPIYTFTIEYTYVDEFDDIAENVALITSATEEEASNELINKECEEGHIVIEYQIVTKREF